MEQLNQKPKIRIGGLKQRQLIKSIWDPGLNGMVGNWVSHWDDWRVCCMDAPFSIPAGSTVWRSCYEAGGANFGDAHESLVFRDGVY